MTPIQQLQTLQTRRQFFGHGKNVLGYAALSSLLADTPSKASSTYLQQPHFAPKAKRVIYLHMVGGPSQMDLFDYKPKMQDTTIKTSLPASARASVSPP